MPDEIARKVSIVPSISIFAVRRTRCISFGIEDSGYQSLEVLFEGRIYRRILYQVSQAAMCAKHRLKRVEVNWTHSKRDIGRAGQ